MFVFRASTILRAFEEHLPEMARGFQAILAARGSATEAQTLQDVFSSFSSVSIDVGIMEKVTNVLMVDRSALWMD